MAQTVAGIDVGGTFTDLLIYEDGEDGRPRFRLAKTPTTLTNQALGVLNAIEGAKSSPAELDLIVHGTTTTTNAILERKIARCGLITTKGFRDVLELGRRTRPNPYGMTGQFKPLIGRDLRLEVSERMNAHGKIVTPLDEDQLRTQISQLVEMGAISLVIHFLHAYANPAHELRALEIARQIWPNEYITLGHKVLSEYREYERGTTASINAAIQPILHRYIDDLARRLKQAGYAHDLLVMNGNGGTVSAGLVSDQAVKTVMSGPASGVMAAARIAEDAGIENVITYDMGGTSTDVALVSGGVPEISSELAIDYGLPIHVPMVDVRTLGAGGGSMGFINTGGLLQVGPESAGSDPGPICYGRGGTRVTITDANLVLGRLDATRLPAIDGKSDIELVRKTLTKDIADPLGLTLEQAAHAMVHIANTQMAGAIRMVSIARGHDPRDYALLAFGGAGPLHATALARELAIPKVLVPARPGLTNALGCLIADLRQDMVNTVNRPLDDVDMDQVYEIFDAQAELGKSLNAKHEDLIENTEIFYSADMQFKGQTHLLKVKISSNRISKAQLQVLFEKAYLERFQVELEEIKAVLVNLNTSVIGRRQRISLAGLVDAQTRANTLGDALTGTRPVFYDGDWHDTAIYDRLMVPDGAEIAGPAILEQTDATVWVEPETIARCDRFSNLLIDVPLAASVAQNQGAAA